MAGTCLMPPHIPGGGVYQSALNTFEASKDAARTGKGSLYKAGAYNKNASTRWLFVWDSVTAGTGTLLLPPIPIATASFVVISDLCGITFSTGLSFSFSDSATTYNLAGADASFHVGWGER